MEDLFNPSLSKFVPVINYDCDCFFIFLEFVLLCIHTFSKHGICISVACELP